MGLLALVGATLLKAVLPGLATLASGYVVRLLHLQAKKTKIELTAEQEAVIAALVERAVLSVEEQARRHDKDQGSGIVVEPPMTGTEKTNRAVAMVLQEKPDVPIGLVTQLIDQVLQQTRRR
jgi:hypothetical protein